MALDASELAGGEQARLRVWVHDGFATGMAESEPFRVASKPPRVSLRLVAPGSASLLSKDGDEPQIAVGHEMIFKAEIWDPDADASTDGLRWSLDGKGLKRSGPWLTLRGLACGWFEARRLGGAEIPGPQPKRVTGGSHADNFAA